ncbi:MAG: helix-turn-helix domain-containing protein [Pseudomonadota bacterium]
MDTPANEASTEAAIGGAQAIRRAAAVLRALGKAGPHGTTLAEVARDCGLARSTAHRILRCLVEERLASEPGADKRYSMGELVHELSLAPSASVLEVAHWRPVIASISRRTGATAYLMRRSGVEAVCLAKADSQALMRFVPVEVGQRRLLGVGAGATTLLAALDKEHCEQVIALVTPGLRPYPRLNPDSLRHAVRVARKTGFAVSQGTVVADGFGMGIAVPSASGTPHLALSIAAHASVVTESVIGEWKRILSQELKDGLAAGGPVRISA